MTARCGCRRALQGIVIGARVFSRKGTEKDERAKDIEDQEKEKLLADQRDEMRIISESFHNRMGRLLLGRITAVRLVDDKGKVLCAKGQKSTSRRSLRFPPALLGRDPARGQGR